MKISLNWLKDYLDIKKTSEELMDVLNSLGHEVESIEKIGDDFILDLEITPNRGDCLSVLGIARELGAALNLKLKTKKPETLFKTEDLNKPLNINVSNPAICPRFTARVIDDIEIAPSPLEIQQRLISYGFRPINNIVDITNYVMIETGQPLHAFDYNKIETVVGKKLVRLRQARAGEKVITLDGKNRFLNEGAIIIEDNKKIYDLTGIMGGLNSEIDQKTKTIILQGAIFDPILIRKTSKYLNLVTDASYRYERGVDINGTIYAVNLATSFILNSCKQAKAGHLIDKTFKQIASAKIFYNIADINKLLGTDISINQAEEFLRRLNFEVGNEMRENIVKTYAIPPSYRAYDVMIWQDLAEEIARIKGYNHLRKQNWPKQKAKRLNIQYALSEFIKDILVASGYNEVYSYSFSDEKTLKTLGLFSDKIVEVEKPLSPETRYLRPDLLPSLLAQIAKNPWAKEIKIFEIGNCFLGKKEFKQIAIVQTSGSYKEMEEVVKTIKEKLKVSEINYEVFKIPKQILNQMKIRKDVFFLRMDFDILARQLNNFNYQPSHTPKKVQFKPISKFAPTVKDLAFVVDRKIQPQDIAKEIKSTDDKVKLVELFDEFISDKFGQTKKSLAFHIWLEDMERPLEEEETRKILKKITRHLSEKFNAILRGEVV